MASRLHSVTLVIVMLDSMVTALQIPYTPFSQYGSNLILEIMLKSEVVEGVAGQEQFGPEVYLPTTNRSTIIVFDVYRVCTPHGSNQISTNPCTLIRDMLAIVSTPDVPDRADNWQACNSPEAAPGMHYHAVNGTPLVNYERFPSLGDMVKHAHSLNLTSGFCKRRFPVAVAIVATYQWPDLPHPLCYPCQYDHKHFECLRPC